MRRGEMIKKRVFVDCVRIFFNETIGTMNLVQTKDSTVNFLSWPEVSPGKTKSIRSLCIAFMLPIYPFYSNQYQHCLTNHAVQIVIDAFMRDLLTYNLSTKFNYNQVILRKCHVHKCNVIYVQHPTMRQIFYEATS